MPRVDSQNVRRPAALWSAALAVCAFGLGLKLGVRPTLGPLTGLLLAVTLAMGVGCARALRSPRPHLGSRPPRRALASWVLLSGITICLSEGVLALVMPRVAPLLRRHGVMRRGDGPRLMGADAFERFLRTSFDAELGWDQPRDFPPFGRARPAPGDYATALIAAYGDSYTECKGADEETWEAHLSARLGTRVINYGVSGYGPDQALLKFRRERRTQPTPVVLIGYLCENVARLVNVYRFAYDAWATGSVFDAGGRPFWSPTKPRFVLREGGLELRPNPVRDRDALEHLLGDPVFAARLAEDDFFAAGYRIERSAPTLGFPHLLTLPRALWRVLARRPRPDVVAGLMRDAAARALLFAVLDAFAAEALDGGAQPVVVLFGQQEDLEAYSREGQHLHLGPVVEHLRARGVAYVDSVALLASQRRRLSVTPPLSDYYDSGSHHSAYAQRVLAEELEPFVRAALRQAGVH